jgi:hypothetical protein
VAQVAAVSLQYVYAPVQAVVSGNAIDPTGDVVNMAFIAGDADPGSLDWAVASWEPGGGPSVFLARCLVGPGGAKNLQAGVYRIWVQIIDTPEIPVLRSDTLVVV